MLRLKGAGVLTMPTIGAKRHAEKVAALGVDAIIAQGTRAAATRARCRPPLLLPQVTSAVDIPVLGAGGFFDGRGLVAALAYGAAGIAMGTRFLLTRESTVPDAVKQHVPRDAGDRHGGHARHRRLPAAGHPDDRSSRRSSAPAA